MWSCISGLFNLFLRGGLQGPSSSWAGSWPLMLSMPLATTLTPCNFELRSRLRNLPSGAIITWVHRVILFQILYLSLKGNKHKSVYYAVYNTLKRTYNACVWIMEALTLWIFSRMVVKCMTGTTDEVILWRILTFDPRHTQTWCTESFSLNKHFIFHT